MRPAQQLRRDRAVNATADVKNAMVLGFCPCASWCRCVWGASEAGEDVVATAGCGGRHGELRRHLPPPFPHAEVGLHLTSVASPLLDPQDPAVPCKTMNLTDK